MAHTRDMTKTATLALWAVALTALYLCMVPVLDFLNSTFSTFTQIGL